MVPSTRLKLFVIPASPDLKKADFIKDNNLHNHNKMSIPGLGQAAPAVSIYL